MGNTNRYNRLAQSTGDVIINNNEAVVVGIESLPINPIVPGGVFFVDLNGTLVQCLAIGGIGISGTPDNLAVNFNTITTDNQGLVMMDNTGNVIFQPITEN